MELTELRQELLEKALEILNQRYKITKKFSELQAENLIATNQKVENMLQYMPPMYTPDEAITMAKLMEEYIFSPKK